MLEVKNLTKVYSGKGGVEVRALNNVSVTFPERGMVFLLGKSGSGKSTLLNVAGGLDKPDGGEVIVKGRSSRDFSASDFDSYRNTFIGFVFQEYNILNEFTIEQNIALALQLQSKPNDKAAVEALLEQVDLKGYGKRKPNTLSGGQKQRVAIARALIKEPEIIMADEPTGALDSTTGKQVLDTLKKLSKEKLIIVVSHDRDFAEFYADRIIELKDGEVISDVSKTFYEPKISTENVNMVSEDTITVKKAETLTDDDVRHIAEMLRKNGGEAVITTGKRELPDVKRACRINDNGTKETFKDTEVVEVAAYDGSQTKFIKSRLPLGHAVKMGASGLKSKPIRLIFTILLAVAAFVMFGVVSTFMLYDPDYSISEAMKEANYPSIRVNKYYTYVRNGYEVDNTTGEKTLEEVRENEQITLFGASEVATRSKDGLDYAGVFHFSDNRDSNGFSLSVYKNDNYLPINVKAEFSDYYISDRAVGFSDCGKTYLTRNQFAMIGEYPASADEVMLTEYLANLFVVTADNGINSINDLIGKKVRITGEAMGSSASFTVSGIAKTGTIPESYNDLRDKPDAISRDKKEAMQMTLKDVLEKGFLTIVFVSDDFYGKYAENISHYGNNVYVPGQYYESIRMERWYFELGESEDITNYSAGFYTEKTMSDYANIMHFYDLAGTEQANYSLADGQVYISKNRYNDILRDYVNNYAWRLGNYAKYDEQACEELGEDYNSDTQFRAALNNSYDKASQAILLKALDKWYATLAYKNYLYQAAGNLKDWAYSDYATDEAFLAAFDKIYNYYNYSGDYYSEKEDEEKEAPAAPAAPTAADWTVLETVVNRDFKAKFLREYYSKILESFYSIQATFGSEISDYNNQRWNYTDEEYVATGVTAKIDEALSALGMNPNDLKTVFVFNRALAFGKIYYVGVRGGATESLDIVGYFDYGTDSTWAEYFVKESFLSANARVRRDNYNQYTYVEEIITNYVAPKDAKYNALLSRTDNSLSQISAALAAKENEIYRLDNSVSDELGYFLDMIEDLTSIFLYVGLGVGLLASFFLLNFISVSISTKKKDIGILRAVGARGSDVFKIFYAESFIIAFICFVLACVGSFFVCFFLNKSIALDGVTLHLLNFGPLNGLIILGVSILVSLFATFLPVYFAARKSPVESIRAL